MTKIDKCVSIEAAFCVEKCFMVLFPSHDLHGKILANRYRIINGRLTSSCEVPISSRSLRYGDGLFETLLVHRKIPYLWNYHMDRLNNGLEYLFMPAVDGAKLHTELNTLLTHIGLTDCIARIIVTRNSETERGYLPDLNNTDLHTIIELSTFGQNDLSDGVDLCISEVKKSSCRGKLNACKSLSAVDFVASSLCAKHKHCYDALMLNERMEVCEASSSNIFWGSCSEHNLSLKTPSIDCGLLPGITRRRLVELLDGEISEGYYDINNLISSKAAVLTNSCNLAIPIRSIKLSHDNTKLFPDSKTLSKIVLEKLIADLEQQ